MVVSWFESHSLLSHFPPLYHGVWQWNKPPKNSHHTLTSIILRSLEWFEWNVDGCGSKNRHQKEVCLKEIRLRARSMLTILGSMINKIRLTQMTTWWAQESSQLVLNHIWALRIIRQMATDTIWTYWLCDANPTRSRCREKIYMINTPPPLSNLLLGSYFRSSCKVKPIIQTFVTNLVSLIWCHAQYSRAPQYSTKPQNHYIVQDITFHKLI